MNNNINNLSSSVNNIKDPRIDKSKVHTPQPVPPPFRSPIAPTTSYRSNLSFPKESGPHSSNTIESPLPPMAPPTPTYNVMSPLTPSYSSTPSNYNTQKVRHSKSRCQTPACQKILKDAEMFHSYLYHTKQKSKAQQGEIEELRRKLTAEIQNNHESASARQEISVLKQRQCIMNSDLISARNNLLEWQRKYNDLETELVNIKARLSDATAKLHENPTRYNALQQELREKNGRLERQLKEMENTLDKEIALNNEFVKVRDETDQTLRRELEESKAERDSAKNEANGYKSELLTKMEELKKCNKQIADLMESEKGLKEKLQQQEDQSGRMDQAIQERDGTIEALRREVDTELKAKVASMKEVELARVRHEQEIATLKQRMNGTRQLHQQTTQTNGLKRPRMEEPQSSKQVPDPLRPTVLQTNTTQQNRDQVPQEDDDDIEIIEVVQKKSDHSNRRPRSRSGKHGTATSPRQHRQFIPKVNIYEHTSAVHISQVPVGEPADAYLRCYDNLLLTPTSELDLPNQIQFGGPSSSTH